MPPLSFKGLLNKFLANAALLIGGLTMAWSVHAMDIDFKPVAPGVFVYVGDTEGRTYENEALNANIGLVVTSEGAVLVDSGATLKTGRKIAEAAKRVTSQPIRWVINTGGQDHRWLGNGYFKSQGAEIIAHANAQSDMKARGQEQLRANAPVLKEKQDGTEPVYPARWLEGDDNVLEIGGVRMQFVHRNGGHTPGDMMVYLPETGVVFTGDVVYVDRILGLHPVSKIKNWIASFEALQALKPRIVVPGHGNDSDLAQAERDTGSLLKALREHMGKAVDAGTDISEAVKSFDTKPFKHLKHVDVWMPQLANLTYLEMEQE